MACYSFTFNTNYMYKTMFFSAVVLFSIATVATVRAQCVSCSVDKTYEAQYCYMDSLFSNYCVAFNENKKYFLLNTERKTVQIPYGDESTDYFLRLIRERSLRISAEGLLFMQLALKKWTIESRKIGYTFQESGLGIKIIKEGKGDFPKNEENVRVHYAGYLEDGTKFDSSYDRDEPIEFPLGTGRVIKGWDEGIAALRKGTKAWLYIPSKIAYGDTGKGLIPPKSTLIFQIEVLE